MDNVISTNRYKTALVCGADGFIGHHLVKRLQSEGYRVTGVDLHKDLYTDNTADVFYQGDLRDQSFCRELFNNSFEEIYQLAADMGGAGFIFTGENDADIMMNDTLINLNILRALQKSKTKKIFYSSSACIYPAHNQLDPANPTTKEDSAYPAAPDSEYGWEKLYAERLYLAYARCHGIAVRIARLHNIFGPEGSWDNGREKSPAALCRKIAEAAPHGEIEIWGDGLQTRSYLYIDECIEGIRRLMRSDWALPINIGSDEMVSINELAERIMQIANKRVRLKHIEGPQGVRGRNSDNALIFDQLGWRPTASLMEGLALTYRWIEQQVLNKTTVSASALDTH